MSIALSVGSQRLCAGAEQHLDERSTQSMSRNVGDDRLVALVARIDVVTCLHEESDEALEILRSHALIRAQQAREIRIAASAHDGLREKFLHASVIPHFADDLFLFGLLFRGWARGKRRHRVRAGPALREGYHTDRQRRTKLPCFLARSTESNVMK